MINEEPSSGPLARKDLREQLDRFVSGLKRWRKWLGAQNKVSPIGEAQNSNQLNESSIVAQLSNVADIVDEALCAYYCPMCDEFIFHTPTLKNFEEVHSLKERLNEVVELTAIGEFQHYCGMMISAESIYHLSYHHFLKNLDKDLMIRAFLKEDGSWVWYAQLQNDELTIELQEVSELEIYKHFQSPYLSRNFLKSYLSQLHLNFEASSNHDAPLDEGALKLEPGVFGCPIAGTFSIDSAEQLELLKNELEEVAGNEDTAGQVEFVALSNLVQQDDIWEKSAIAVWVPSEVRDAICDSQFDFIFAINVNYLQTLVQNKVLQLNFTSEFHTETHELIIKMGDAQMSLSMQALLRWAVASGEPLALGIHHYFQRGAFLEAQRNFRVEHLLRDNLAKEIHFELSEGHLLELSRPSEENIHIDLDEFRFELGEQASEFEFLECVQWQLNKPSEIPEDRCPQCGRDVFVTREFVTPDDSSDSAIEVTWDSAADSRYTKVCAAKFSPHRLLLEHEGKSVLKAHDRNFLDALNHHRFEVLRVFGFATLGPEAVGVIGHRICDLLQHPGFIRSFYDTVNLNMEGKIVYGYAHSTHLLLLTGRRVNAPILEEVFSVLQERALESNLSVGEQVKIQAQLRVAAKPEGQIDFLGL
jgi:hypothetical protein